MKKALSVLLAVLLVLGMAACGKSESKTETPSGFAPRLDTNETATVQIAGFLGNYEALDQAINAFQEYYPNVTFYYDQNGVQKLPQYLQNNPDVDIFMTDDHNIKRPTEEDYYVGDSCLDLSKENIDFSAMLPDALAEGTLNGEVLRLPVAINPCGIVVNKTLLKNEGLEVPQNYQEFLTVLKTLKDKGYTPLQGSQEHLYGELMEAMGMNLLHDGESALPAFQRLAELMEYTDYELNCTYPVDNYDGSIMAFFEGKMPFYVCSSECVSGMKKRESKSETYSANPFEYEFLYAPVGDEGAYAYAQSWYGFSVNKNSQEKDLAVEFLRFLMTPERLDSMAAIKGMPSAAVDGKNERYQGLVNAKNIQERFINDGSIPQITCEQFTRVCKDYGAGVYASPEEANEAFEALRNS